MVAFLRSWVLNIVTIIVFITFLEILLPNSSIKKYIKMIVGLLVMLVILSPILELVNGNIKIENEIIKTSSEVEQKYLQVNAHQLEDEQNRQMIEVYKRKMEKDIKERIEYEHSVEVLSIHTYIDEDIKSHAFGSLNQLNITLSVGMTPNRKETKEQFIKPVSIIIGNGDQSITASADQGNHLTDGIKSNISGLYGIREENIKININK